MVIHPNWEVNQCSWQRLLGCRILMVNKTFLQRLLVDFTLINPEVKRNVTRGEVSPDNYHGTL